MNRMIRLYPKAWRERYGDEFAQVVNDLRADGRHPSTWDIARGAVDAHLQRRFGMMRVFANPAVRRGLYDGLIISSLIAVLVVLTNVVFPGGPDESDSDPEYVVQYLITVGVLALLLVVIGARGRGRGRSLWDGAKAGATAGALIAVMVTLIFLVVNNLFLDIVSQQHDKRVAFAGSGWTSMRAYLTVTQLEGGLFLVPVMAFVGATLGLLGGALRGLRAKPPSRLTGQG